MTRLAELSGSRELVVNLTLRELRGKYKRSFLGWGWSLINPLLTVAIYWLVFGVFLDITAPTGDPSGLSSFVLFLVCGLLPFTFFQNCVEAAPEVLVSNGNLIKKVYFPREILVISAVNAMLMTFFIELGVLAALLLVAGNMVLPWIPVVIALVFLEMLLCLGVSLVLSVLNVYFRDTKHFTKIAMQLLFYATPIVYPIRFVPVESEIGGVTIPVRQIYELNPLVRMVGAYRDVLYDLRFPSWGDVGYFALWAVGLVAFGWWLFHRLEGRIAEEV
jgi:ABC-type polysaccharide/polyol phosphate export permease